MKSEDKTRGSSAEATRVLGAAAPASEPSPLLAPKPAETGNGLAPEIDPFHSDPFIGRIVGNCRILEKINEGGSSFIYRALNVNFNLERVVKILKPALAEDRDYFEGFKQEAQLTARLDHPNILRVFDTGEIGRQFFIEMEYVGGQSLREFMHRQQRIREIDILGIASQIAQALDYAHHARIQTPSGETLIGILHRDLKPENIMLPPGGGLKLMDFGAAKPLSLNSKTPQGTIVGTPHYMSPEQINGEALDARSDFFSLGVVLYELCCGQRPFDSENLAILLARLDAGKYTPLRKLRPSISPLTEELVEKLLAKSPQRRPASAKEILQSLQIALRTQQQWGAGARAKVPFSLRRAFPSIALGFSTVALLLSGFLAVRFFPLWRNPGGLKAHFTALVAKGLDAERKGDLDAALNLYDLMPPPSRGGDPQSYLLSQLEAANIYMQRGQLTKARAMLEDLHNHYRDPAVDAYLGMLYFKSALYLEAKDHLQAALDSPRQTVLRLSDDFTPSALHADILYYLADAWDGQFTFVNKLPEYRDKAVAAYHSYLDFACSGSNADKHCETAKKRLQELTNHP